jgi:5-methylcytosine-specific restriction endonuclease McrA
LAQAGLMKKLIGRLSHNNTVYIYSIYELSRIQQICYSNIKIDAIMLGKIRQKLLANTFPREVSATELICPICDRPIPATQKDAHHFVPKSKGGKATEYLHRICHRQIHALFTETQLARELNTAEAIREKAEMQKFIAWVQTKPNDFYQRSSKSQQFKNAKNLV